jgi:hypothetical protein
MNRLFLDYCVMKDLQFSLSFWVHFELETGEIGGFGFGPIGIGIGI